MDDALTITRELREPARELRDRIPAVYEGFRAIGSAALSDGALPAKTKELMALVASVVKHCDGCIVAHARGAHRQGATADEVAEALGVAILMDGGTATVSAPRAWRIYQELASPHDVS